MNVFVVLRIKKKYIYTIVEYSWELNRTELQWLMINTSKSSMTDTEFWGHVVTG